METCQNIALEASEVELVYKTKIKASNRPTANTAAKAFRVLFNAWNKDKIELLEQFKILLLDRSNKVLGICEISSGGISGTVVDAKLVFVAALKAHASKIILCHNHPSGNLKPSSQDISLTRNLEKAGEFLDIPVLDHIIITMESYYSFADEGLL